MYRFFIIVIIFVKTVNSHGGHGDAMRTKQAIQDALLSFHCQGANGFPCNDHGSCSGGQCTCYHGYSGLQCEINDADITNIGDTRDTLSGSLDVGGFSLHDLISPLEEVTDPPTQIIACLSSDENPCNGNGFCHEGNCICESGYSGIICELSHEQGFCKTYKECAECTAFMNDCPKKCSLIAKFRLVFGFPGTGGGSFRKCRFRNSDFNCTYYFQQESESPQGMKTIAVKACLNYNEATTKANDTIEQLKDKPLQPVTSSPTQARTTSSPDDVRDAGDHSHEPHDTHSHGDHTHDNTNDAGKQDKSKGDSGASLTKPCIFVIIGSILMLL